MSSENCRLRRSGRDAVLGHTPARQFLEPVERAVDALRLERRGHDIDLLVDVQDVGRGRRRRRNQVDAVSR